MSTTSNYQQYLVESTPEKALTFLRALATKVEIRAAMLGCGYSEREQREGWQLLLTATGYPPGTLELTDDQKARAAIAELDEWDEAGFRRIHAALGRLHPEQDAFVFSALEAQQGAGAVMSVSRLLDRLDALESGAGRDGTREADAAAIATLERRGITAALRKHLRDLVTIAQSAKPPVRTASTIANMDEQRQEALLALYAWYRDWSETARAAIHRRDHLVMMGLAKRTMRKDGEAPEPTTPEPVPNTVPSTAAPLASKPALNS